MKKGNNATIVVLALMLMSNAYSQQKMNTEMTNKEAVLTFLNGFNDPSKIGTSLDLLVEDYKFTNPMVSLNSKAEFISLAQEIGQVLTGVDVLRVAEGDNWVTVMYNFKSAIPGVENNLATEWFKVKDGKIIESTLLYDASEWRKVYAAMEKN